MTSILNNMYQSAKKHTGKIMTGALIVGALAGIIGCARSIGEEVYRGNINGEVVYEEGIFSVSGNSAFQENRMVVKTGNQTHILLDTTDEKGIKSPDFEGQKLEKILICSETGTQSFYSQKEYGQDLGGQHTKSVFERGNALYNNLRAKIRTEIESDYKTIEERIPQ